MNADHHDGTELPTIEICGDDEYVAGLFGLLDLDGIDMDDDGQDQNEAHGTWFEAFTDRLDGLGVRWQVNHGTCSQWNGRKWFGASGRGWGCDSSLPPSVIGAIEAAAIAAEIYAEREMERLQAERDADVARNDAYAAYREVREYANPDN